MTITSLNKVIAHYRTPRSMKIPSLICAAILLTLITSCGQERESLSQIYISGQVADPEQETYYLVRSTDGQGWKNYYKAEDSCRVDSLGYFHFELDLRSSDFFQIRDAGGFTIHKHELYLEPGDSLQLAVHAKGVALSGKASTLNNLSWKIDEWRTKDDGSKQVYAGRRSLEPKDFMVFINKVKKEREYLIENDTTNQLIPDKYNDYLAAEIQSQWTMDVFDYLKYHNYYAHDNWSYLSEDSLGINILDHWSPDSNYHFIDNYWECIDGYVNHRLEARNLEVADSVKWANMLGDKFSIVKDDLSGINQNIGLLSISREFWRYLSPPEDAFYAQTKKMNDYFLLNKESEQYYDLFRQNYLAFQGVAPGKKAPGFSFPNTAGDEISLSDFGGKVVYIDFWGTWCGPCIEAIPKHLVLQESFKDTDGIVYLYVALEYDEEDIERWKQFVADRDWPGVHLVANKQFLNPQLKPYKLNAAPTHVLIDQAGNIVNPRANGPVDVVQDIRRLLGE
jgi:thiol-disulfide isomerase/thioredoxin